MTSAFVKRSQFQFISITDATIKQVLIEGDEAFVSVMNSNGNSISVRRQRERDLKKALDANGGLSSGNTSLGEWQFVDFSYGTVPLDVPTTGGYIFNMPITMAATDKTNAERIRKPNVGFKEYVDVKANGTTYPINLCIETVHYVPAETISA